MASKFTKQLQARFKQLKGNRATWEDHWQDVVDLFIPRKDNIQRLRSVGQKKNIRLFDSTGIKSNSTLAGALHGLLTNPSVQWFELTTGVTELDDNDEVRKYLQEVTRRIHNTLNNSNFQTEIHEVYLDLGSIGTAPLLIEDDDVKHVRFSARNIAETVIAENARGIIDEVHREFEWEARKVIEEYGAENVGKAVLDAMKKDVTTKFKIQHSVVPREKDRIAEGKGPKGFPFASIHILQKDGKMIRESGFREFPYAVPRWAKASNEMYGRSPAMEALPDMRMLNEMKLTTLRGAQKTVDPPLQMPDDGFLGRLDLRPAGINYFRSGSSATDRVQPIITNARIDFGFQMIDKTAQSIKDAFFEDQLRLIRGPQMTATEVLQRREEALRLLGPVLGRQQSELLRPMIDRVFGIMDRKQLFPEAPEVLRGLKVDVQYSSLIARAQRSSEVSNISRTIESIAPIIAADPTVMDNIDGDKALRFAARLNGLPAEILKDKKDVEKVRQARAEANAEAEAAAQQAAQAEALGKAGPAVAKLQAV